MNIISSASRQVILDTETTGMNQAGGPIYVGHRIIEIGCVELINRRLTGRTYHQYIILVKRLMKRQFKFTVLPMTVLPTNRVFIK